MGNERVIPTDILTLTSADLGRSQNRRMEIDIRNPQLQGRRVASTPEQGVSP